MTQKMALGHYSSRNRDVLALSDCTEYEKWYTVPLMWIKPATARTVNSRGPTTSSRAKTQPKPN